MGGGHYEGDVEERSSSTGRDVFTYQGYAGSDPGMASDPARRECYPELNILGKKRECRDSAEHPETTPIVVAMDVTRSRGDDAKVIYGKLPMFIGQIILKGYVPDPAISFAAIGDATSGDRAPIQVGGFESDNRLDEVLSKIWLEEGGGGTGRESYELMAYYYARHSLLDAAARGKKGYFFFVGDEGFYDKVDKEQVKRWIGDDLPEDLPAEQVFRELQRYYHVFFIYPQKSWQERRQDIDAEIKKRVEEAGGLYAGVDIRASLLWNNHNDLDLHVITPAGYHIYYADKRSTCGGWLDVDMNVNGETMKPVENIRWKKGDARTGSYKIYVQNYRFHESSREATPFRVEVEINGKIMHFSGQTPHGKSGPESDIPVYEFNYQPDTGRQEEAVNIYTGYDDRLILDQWGRVLPKENILIIDDPAAIVDVMLGALSLVEGTSDLDDYLVDMQGRGQTELRQGQTRKALEGLSANTTAIAKVEANSLAKPRKRRTGKSKRL
jgi:hypothetical protein